MNVCFFLFFTSADPPIGKIDKGTLSQQTLMELLIGGFTMNKEAICGYPNNIKGISQWTGLKFNGSDEIVEINWLWKTIGGPIELKWLPQSLQKAYFSGNRMSGTVDLTCLPDNMNYLALSINRFEGTVDLTSLPSGIHTLLLNDNNFRGQTDFSHLPKSLTELDMTETLIEGEIFEFDGYLKVYNSNVKDMRNA